MGTSKARICFSHAVYNQTAAVHSLEAVGTVLMKTVIPHESWMMTLA